MSLGDNVVGLLAAAGLSVLLSVHSAAALVGFPLIGAAFAVACYLDWRAP